MNVRAVGVKMRQVPAVSLVDNSQTGAWNLVQNSVLRRACLSAILCIHLKRHMRAHAFSWTFVRYSHFEYFVDFDLVVLVDLVG